MNILKPDELGLVSKCPECGQLNRLGYRKLGQGFRCGKCHISLNPPGETFEIETEPVFDALTHNSGFPVLVDFWAPWCGPCKMVAPELMKVAAEGRGRWLVAKVNTDALPAVAQRYQIQAIPTLILFSQGREVARQSGALAAPAIRRFIERGEPIQA